MISLAPPLSPDWSLPGAVTTAMPPLAAAPQTRLLALLAAYGYEYQSFLSLADRAQVWFAQANEGAVVFQCCQQVAIVTAAPLAAPEHWAAVTQEFLTYCRAQNLSCLMLPVSAAYAQIARTCGMGLLPIGTSGYFSLPTWQPTGDRAKKVRAGVNQARKAGITVMHLAPPAKLSLPTQAAIAELCQVWLQSHAIAPLDWLLALAPCQWSAYKHYFLAYQADGQMVGILVCSPFAARQGWYLEDLIRRPDAARGVNELLVVTALQSLAQTGAQLATLGTSPLAELRPESGQFPRLTRLLRWCYRYGDRIYPCQSLHRFKTKFAPTFVEQEYIAIWPPRVQGRMVQGLLHLLHPGGWRGLCLTKWQKFWCPLVTNARS